MLSEYPHKSRALALIPGTESRQADPSGHQLHRPGHCGKQDHLPARPRVTGGGGGSENGEGLAGMTLILARKGFSRQWLGAQTLKPEV